MNELKITEAVRHGIRLILGDEKELDILIEPEDLIESITQAIIQALLISPELQFEKIQARLEAAEAVCETSERWHWGTHHEKCPLQDCATCAALDNWRKVKREAR